MKFKESKKIRAILSLLIAYILITASISINACSSTIELEKSQNEKITFYVDANSGNDKNSGTSPENAFATLNKFNNTELQPGTKILLKSGTSYEGPIIFSGTGTASSQILISNYGGDKKPLIKGQGTEKYALKIYNSNYLELKNIEITNTGNEPEAGRRGVIIEAKDCKLSKHIILDNLFIHDVNGSLVKKDGGGSAILWQNHGTHYKTKFDSLIIQNCHIKNCTRNAINSRGYTNRNNWYPSTNVIIRNNLIEGVPGDGIVPIGTDGTLIEYNLMRDCPDVMPKGDAAAGIWPWSADNTLIQFNEVSGHKAKWDAQGFDSDWNCLNTTIQYNYSHDNYGGFLLVCNNGSKYNTPTNIGTKNTIVQYNISVNDGIRPYETHRSWFSPIMHISGPVENTLLFSNIFIIPEKQKKEIDRTVVQMDNWGGPWPNKTFFYKNIFSLSELGEMKYGKDKATSAKQNIIETKNFGLIEDNNSNIPAWAASTVNSVDTDYKAKLINTFFKDNTQMKKVISELGNE
ncbi:MAG: right-handed parallel beta-helix repeat-containing protein [Bacteroidetes bacterium]|nr:right-handed parallel beta-helix repeat-containing protein [Bacteroidota bacterium]